MKPRKLLQTAPFALALATGLILMSGPGIAWAADEESERSKERVTTESRADRSKGGDAAERGYLGVQVQDVTRSLRRAKNLPGMDGALVNRVEEGSPADKAGLKTGDLILEVNRVAIEDAGQLTRTVRGLKPGTRAAVAVHREGDRWTLTVEIGSRPEDLDEDPRVFIRRWRSDGDGPEWRGRPGEMPPMPREFMLRHHNELEQELDRIQDQLEQLREEMRALREDLRERSLLRENQRRDRDGGNRQND